MRVEFSEGLIEIMKQNSRSIFLTGDLGFNAFESLQSEFGASGRMINAGVAEQNMVGVSAGLAIEGFRPWIYSIAPFLTFRCVEQIRNDICLHNLPVCVVGNGGGYTYGIMGATHHTLEDMSTLKSLPNLKIFTPVTNSAVKSCLDQITNLDGPSYLRLGFSGFGSNMSPKEENPHTLTRRYSYGTELVIIGIGQGTQVALRAIEEKLIDTDKVSVFGVAKFPFDLLSDKNLFDLCVQTQNVIVVEEHYLPGSLAESFKMALPAIKSFQTLTPYYDKTHMYGSAQFHLSQVQMTPQVLSKMCMKEA